MKITNEKIDEIIELIVDGLTFRDIAKKYDLSLSGLHNFLSKTEHSARVKTAMALSADGYADKAEEVLSDIKPKSTYAELQRARELAQHYRWKSAKRNPRRYSEKVDITSDGEKLASPVINVLPPSHESQPEAE